MTRIMIIEDESITAMALCMEFTGIGYETCMSAASGVKALEQIEHERPDIVLIDLSLQGKLDGLETAKLIRSRWDIPIIFMSGCSDRKSIEKVKDAGFSYYFIKPVDYLKISSAIDELLIRGGGG